MSKKKKTNPAMSFDFEEIMESMHQLSAALDSLPDETSFTPTQLEAVAQLHDSARGLTHSAKTLLEDFTPVDKRTVLRYSND